ncbi:uncharacterized protein PGTG_04638 [Puccinia graminis f. sp. tritici CRL 75-36-700-3]|uniref:TOG domain-containing protein n=1 Tax=Puccinia graminis f. sp. tritici (strain CRL 75-36-700-3 / race SCCL) TaxID=418459 RepID=E3K3N0_PUCGT|nr:uncharacterized protein PGTG_04638 [Puccinia graminis f. sp. tritici CRL 75-36-700-3]EFP78682.1 hypothetical protein PGTG_04638 [Puccinia graminis f. sp. tritici CRL 75-36-700-3]
MAEPPQDSDWQNLSVPDQLNHKLWKARLAGYETLIKQFQLAEDEDDEVFNDWNRDHQWPHKAVTDSNAVAQEKGVLLVSIYIRLAGRAGSRCRSDCITPLVEKSLATNARKGTREAAIECLLGWAMSEADGDKAEGIVSAVLEGLNSKQPKVVAGAVSALNALISAFGVRVINIKLILKALPQMFAHADKGVREEGRLLVQTIYQFLGAALEPSLSGLKPVQVKELQDSFATLDAEGKGKGTGVPTRETAGQMRDRLKREAQAALKESTSDNNPEGDDPAEDREVVEEAPDDIDPYELADPVAILDQLPSGFYEHLGSSKWKERKEEALDPLLAILKPAIKIKNDHYDELIKSLAGRMADANILCVIGAANCMECLAKGLRADFAKYRSLMVVPILEKFKEKKVNVVEALSNCLDAMAATVTLSDLNEDIVTFSKHKNPQVKEQTMKFLVRCLRNTIHAIPKAELKSLSDVMLSGLEDAVVPVREIAAEGLGTLMKLVGKATFTPIIQGQDDLRKVKVEEYYEKAEVKYQPPKAKPKVQAAKPASKAPAKKPAAKPPPRVKSPAPSPVDNGLGSSISSKPPARPAKKPTPSAAPPTKKSIGTAPAPAGGSGNAKATEEVRYKMSQDEAEARAPDCLPASFIEGVGNSLWKTRLAALEELLSWIPEQADEIEAEVVVRYLNKKPGPKESNFQVWQRVFSVINLLAEQCPSFTKACMALTIPSCFEKYGDGKIKEAAGNALITFAEKSSLGFVLSQAFDSISKQKAVKIQAESFLFIDSALIEFGINGVPVRNLIECLKTGLKSVNAAVRTNATKALVTTKLCIGADISNFLQDLNPQLLSSIESDFSKIEGERPPTPTRQSVDVAQASQGEASGAKGKGKSGASGDPLDELFPRVDLDRLVSSSTIKACDDPAWKTRKEALTTIQDILEQNKRLKPNLGPDLTASLKLRLADANKAVQTLALDVVSRLATGMGKPFERHVKPLAPAILNILADKNATARNNALNTLTVVADSCGLDCLAPSVGTSLEIAKPELRSSALNWFVERLADPDAVKGLDLSTFASPIISCLEDRNAEVRKGATALLPTIVISVGIDSVLEETNNLKPASRNNVVPMIESCRPAAPVKAPVSKAPPNKTASKAAPAASKQQPRPPSAASVPRASTPSRDDRPPLSKSRLGARKPAGSLSAKLAPVASQPSSPAAPAATAEVAFRSGDPKSKTVRASKETGPLKWVIDGAVRKDQIEQLYLQMAPQISPELLGQLFSKDHHCEKDFLAGLNVIETWTSDPSTAAEQVNLEESDIRDRLLANSDLVFKYLTIRLHDTNTTITMKCLDIIDQYITALQLDGYRLTDYEASILLPSLIGRCGDSKEVLRIRIRTIFKNLCGIYPFSKVFQSLIDHGLKAKNARIRAECAEELSALFQRHGLNVCQPAKALPLIAALISDRDSAVRNGALAALASAYASAGDVILKYVKNLSGKEHDMLTERLKRTEAPASPKPDRLPVEPSASPTPRGPAAARRIKPSVLRRPSAAFNPPSEPELNGHPKEALRKPSSLMKSTSSAIPPPTKIHPPAGPARQLSSLDLSRNSSVSSNNISSSKIDPRLSLRPSTSQAQRMAPAASTDSVVSNAVNHPGVIGEILSSDDIRSTDALKSVQADIAEQPDTLISTADAIVDVISTQMKISFENLDASTPPMKLRLCKHLMQTLSTLFDRSQLATAVSKESLVGILAQLTQRLQETADNSSSEHITSLSKVLNMVLIRIFHNADRSACFGALFTVLRMTTIDMREIEDESELGHRAKYAELVMKCLWKVSKTAKESLEDGTLDVSILLRDIDEFLVSIPPAEWRRRANDNVPLADMPLRTVKTILQQVVTIYGDAVYDAVSVLKNPQDTFVYQYLFRLLNNSWTAGGNPSSSRAGGSSRTIMSSASAGARSPPPAFPIPRPPDTTGPRRDSKSSAASFGSTALSKPVPANESSSEVELNNHLTEIFAKIGSPIDSKKGISDLYHLLKMHPEAHSKVDKWISATGTYFQAYLRRALNNLKADDPDFPNGGGSEGLMPSVPASRPATANLPVSPSLSAFGADGGAGGGRISRSQSQDVDLTRLQSLFGFEATTTSPTRAVNME